MGIPDETVDEFCASSGTALEEAKTSIAEKLVELRGSASHLRPDYGLVPTDENRIKEFEEWAPRMRSIARHSLEFNPETSASRSASSAGS